MNIKEIRILNTYAVYLFYRWDRSSKNTTLVKYIYGKAPSNRTFYIRAIIEDYGLYDFNIYHKHLINK